MSRKREPPPRLASAAPSAAPPAAAPPPSRRGLWTVALLLGLAGVVVAVIAIAHRPDYVVLVHMDEPELAWFRARLGGIADQHRVRLSVAAYQDADDLERLLAAGGQGGRKRVLLAQVPQSSLVALVDAQQIEPLEKAAAPVEITRLLDRFERGAAAAGRIEGRPYYVPDQITTLLLFYSKAHVQAAVEHWQAIRPRIQARLKEANGYGLPWDYRLESDPAEWDSYDLAVAGTYWAENAFGGLTVPRMAHPAAGAPAALDLAARVYGLRGSDDDLLTLDGIALRDALVWESFLFRHRLYHPSMTRERWGPSQLLAAAAQGQLFLAPLAPTDLVRLHGTGENGLDGYLRDPDDLGVCRLPAGLSLDIEKRQGARAGSHVGPRAGTWWGIPAGSPDPGLALALVREVSEPAFQYAWCRAFGRLPALGEAFDNLDVVFRDDWMFGIASEARRQIRQRGRMLPASPRWQRAQVALVEAWREACAEQQLARPVAIQGVLTRAAQQAAPSGATSAAPAPPRRD